MNHTQLPIILASTSPRRRELLTTAGVNFQTLAVDIDETWQHGEQPVDYIRRMVEQKAVQASCLATLPTSCLLITADTIGVKDGTVLTKPLDKADAYRMWAMLSDSTHEIWTAVCASLVECGKICQQKMICECTQVDFVAISESMKQRYWETGEPSDKAGAYAIQGGAMAWVKGIRGSYTNVVGLPLSQTLALIDEFIKP
ncbi:Maf family protein [Moraxella sp. ZJ142]|uniref:Maf family protein n=1 Tax=Moraxella marmotae TaxID=3344520 RepID=UPI0035D4826F